MKRDEDKKKWYLGEYLKLPSEGNRDGKTRETGGPQYARCQNCPPPPDNMRSVKLAFLSHPHQGLKPSGSLPSFPYWNKKSDVMGSTKFLLCA